MKIMNRICHYGEKIRKLVLHSSFLVNVIKTLQIMLALVNWARLFWMLHSLHTLVFHVLKRKVLIIFQLTFPKNKNLQKQILLCYLTTMKRFLNYLHLIRYNHVKVSRMSQNQLIQSSLFDWVTLLKRWKILKIWK